MEQQAIGYKERNKHKKLRNKMNSLTKGVTKSQILT